MDIVDRPLSEIIKEQKIGESLRKNRRALRNNNNNNARGTQNPSVAPSRNGRGRGGRAAPQEQRRRRLRMRKNNNNNNGNSGPLRRFGFAGRRRNNNMDIISENNGGLRRRRYAVDIIDDRRDRSVKSFRSQRRGQTAFERNDRLRTRQRQTALSRARSRFSRD